MSYPIHKNKHIKTALFHPKDFLKYAKAKRKNYPKKYIIVFSTRLFSYIQRKFKKRARKVKELGKDMLLLDKVGIIKMKGIGSPQMVTTIEERIAQGGKEFIIVGTAGGLDDFGVYVCDKAIRDEGTSYHYVSHGKYAHPDKKLTEQIATMLEKKKISFKKGTTWTIDAPYRETKSEVEQYKKEGVKTVEMEASALFVLGKVRKVKCAAIFVVSDVLGKKWKPNFNESHVRRKLNQVVEAVVG